MDRERVSWNPNDKVHAPARWYAQHISWLNALAPPVVLWNKIIKAGNDLRFSVEVYGELLSRLLKPPKLSASLLHSSTGSYAHGLALSTQVRAALRVPGLPC